MKKESKRTQLIGIVICLSVLLSILVVVALVLGQNKEDGNSLGEDQTEYQENNPKGTVPIGTSAEMNASENLGEKTETLDATTENSKKESTPNNTEPTDAVKNDMEATQTQATETTHSINEKEDIGEATVETTETEVVPPEEETEPPASTEEAEVETTLDQSNDLGEF